MAEWLKAHAWKACLLERVTWVRIPLSPPYFQWLTVRYHKRPSCQFPASRAKTTTPLAGITTFAEAWKPCSGPPDAKIPPRLPATMGLTPMSQRSLLETSSHDPKYGNP